LDETDDAADGEEITNEIPKVEAEWKRARRRSAGPSDVPDSQGFQAFFQAKSGRISDSTQGLVNHVRQGLVNHAGE